MFIASFPAGPWQTNCYVLATQAGAECVIVDPGMDAVPGVQALVADHRLLPVAVLLTHGHLDHMFSVTPLCAAHDAVCWVHPDDRGLLADPLAGMGADTAALLAQLTGGPVGFTEPDDVRELVDGAAVSVAGLELTAIHAPGHTPGSTMFRCAYDSGCSGAYPPGPDIDSLLFSGDVLFAGSIGRTDLPGGDDAAMRTSLRTKVLPLPDAVAVLPGHGAQTTIAAERAANPYLSSAHLQSSLA